MNVALALANILARLTDAADVVHCAAASCLVAVFFLHVDAAPGTFIYAGCLPSRYAPNMTFESNLNSLRASMASTASVGGP